MAMYRVIRDLGNTDYPVGSQFDGEVFDPRRIHLLTQQGRIVPIKDPNDQVSLLEQQLAELRVENARLQADLDAAATPAEPEPDLSKLTVDKLKALATERGIDGAATMKKDELLAALSAQEGAPDA